jgi:hypothetical protein
MKNILLALLIAAPAFAQPAPDLVALGRREFDAGRADFNLGHYDTALNHFEAAYRLSARPSLLYNLGVTRRRLFDRNRDLDQLTRSVEHFQAFLAAPEITDAAARARAEVDLKEAEQVLAAERAARARGDEILRLATAELAAGRLDAAESQLARFTAQPHERTETVRIHLVRGLIAAARNDEVAATRAFLAALSLDRAARLGSGVTPDTVAGKAFAAARAKAAEQPVVNVAHTPPGALRAGAPRLTITFSLPSDPAQVVAGVDVYYRAGSGAFARLPRATLAVGQETRVDLPADFVRSLQPGGKVEYYVEVADATNGTLQHLGTAALPFVVDIGAPKKPLLKNAAFWGGIGAAAAVVATGIALGVVYGSPPPSTGVTIRLSLLRW